MYIYLHVSLIIQNVIRAIAGLYTIKIGKIAKQITFSKNYNIYKLDIDCHESIIKQNICFSYRVVFRQRLACGIVANNIQL